MSDSDVENKQALSHLVSQYQQSANLEAVCCVLEELRIAVQASLPEGSTTLQRFAFHYCRYMDQALADLEDDNPTLAALVQQVLSEGKM